MSPLRAAGHPAVPRAAHGPERDVREPHAGRAAAQADQDHQHLLSGHAAAGLLNCYQVGVSCQRSGDETVLVCINTYFKKQCIKPKPV